MREAPIERGLLPALREALADYGAVQLRGSRMVGKTTLARQVCASQWNLFDRRRRQQFALDPAAALRSAAKPVLIDEWQAFPDVVPEIKRLLDEEHLSGFVLAGSSEPRHDAWGFGDQHPLAGRSKVLDLWPLSVAEQRGQARRGLIARWFDGEPPSEVERLSHNHYRRLVFRSGYPGTLGASERLARKRLADVRDAIVQYDFARYGDQPADATESNLRRFLRTSAEVTATSTGFNKMANALGFHERTCRNYYNRLERCRLVTSLDIWRPRPSTRSSNRRYRFLTEAAMVPAFAGLPIARVLADDNLAGRTLETFVLSQLRAQQSFSEIDFDIERYHLPPSSRGAGNSGAGLPTGEIDFILRGITRDDLVAVEVTWAARPPIEALKKLIKLRDAVDRSLPTRFCAGLVLTCGDEPVTPIYDRIWAAPLSALWAPSDELAGDQMSGQEQLPLA